MWKNIVLIITVVLAAAAVWLLVDMRENPPLADTTREQFINCKVENIQLTIQYGRCLALYEKKQSTDPDDVLINAEPGGMLGDNDPGGMLGDNDPGNTPALNNNPGGMISDPDPGGMIGTPDSPDFAFDPTAADLKQCGTRNGQFRTALQACVDALKPANEPNGSEAAE